MEGPVYKRKPTGLLIGGLIVNIIALLAYFIFFLVIIVIFGLAMALAVSAGGAIAGEEGASQAAQNVEMPPELGVALVICIFLGIYALVAIGLTIAALVVCSKAKSRKACITAGILAIIGSIPAIIIPLELIGGIKLLRMQDKDFEEDPVYWKD